MQHSVLTVQPLEKQDLIVLPWWKDGSVEKSHFWQRLTDEGRQYLTRVTQDLKGGWLEMSYAVLPYDGAPKVLLVGLGDRAQWTMRKLVLASRKVMQEAKAHSATSVVVAPQDFGVEGALLARVTEIMATNFVMAGYSFDKYKSKKDDGDAVKSDVTTIRYIVDDGMEDSISDAAVAGTIIGEQVNAARDLVNIPGGDLTPVGLAEAARAMAEPLGVVVKTLGEKEMAELGMGGILGVSRGSVSEAQLIVLEYMQGPADEKPLVFVGKGITFDSGGLHLKPSNSMDEMHMDMGGAGAVIAAVAAIARLKLKINVVGLAPSAENMVNGESYRPGDILKSMSGQTIEVVSPDAEGRVVLADALTYAERYEPSLVVDVATLTGAVIVALGHYANAYMTPQSEVAQELRIASEASGDYGWELPLWDEYEAMIKGEVGDILNAGKNREAGTINGGMFLYQFAKKFSRWAHVDIASTMTTSSDQFLSKGASGSGTRLLVELARTRAKRGA